MGNPYPPFTHESVQRMLSFLPAFERGEFQGAHDFYMKSGHNPPNVDELNSAVHQSGFVFPFNWADWDWRKEFQAIDSANMLTLRKLMTAFVRGDRFSGGAMPGHCANGSVQSLLSRLNAVAAAASALDETIATRLANLRSGLRDAAVRKLSPFGLSDRDFTLETPAIETEVLEFEHLTGVSLPADYRAFITTLGDGGVGPAYGLLPLAEGLDRELGRVTPELLQTPFPFTEFANALDLYDPKTDEYPPRPGSITIADAGCNVRHFIVVNGPTRGQVWIDHTTADGGYWPLDVDFLTWYERWLTDTLNGNDGIWWRGFLPRGFTR